jgi:hypothetical protein
VNRLTASHVTTALRVITATFAGFAGLNILVFWSFRQWWPSPTTSADWTLAVLALLAWAPQVISFAVFDLMEGFRQFDTLESLFIVTVLSAVTYTPLILWYRDRPRRRTMRCS